MKNIRILLLTIAFSFLSFSNCEPQDFPIPTKAQLVKDLNSDDPYKRERAANLLAVVIKKDSKLAAEIEKINKETQDANLKILTEQILLQGGIRKKEEKKPDSFSKGATPPPAYKEVFEFSEKERKLLAKYNFSVTSLDYFFSEEEKTKELREIFEDFNLPYELENYLEIFWLGEDFNVRDFIKVLLRLRKKKKKVLADAPKNLKPVSQLLCRHLNIKEGFVATVSDDKFHKDDIVLAIDGQYLNVRNLWLLNEAFKEALLIRDGKRITIRY